MSTWGGGTPASRPCQRSPPDKAIPYLAACGRANFTQAAFLHLPSLAACLANRVLQKGDARGGLGEERQLMLLLRVCVYRDEGGQALNPGFLGAVSFS